MIELLPFFKSGTNIMDVRKLVEHSPHKHVIMDMIFRYRRYRVYNVILEDIPSTMCRPISQPRFGIRMPYDMDIITTS